MATAIKKTISLPPELAKEADLILPGSSAIKKLYSLW